MAFSITQPCHGRVSHASRETAYAIVFDQFAYQLRNSVYCASA